MIYRVIIKAEYNEAYFDFNDVDDAVRFGAIALMHSVASEYQRKASSITMKVINKENYNQEEDEED